MTFGGILYLRNEIALILRWEVSVIYTCNDQPPTNPRSPFAHLNVAFPLLKPQARVPPPRPKFHTCSGMARNAKLSGRQVIKSFPRTKRRLPLDGSLKNPQRGRSFAKQSLRFLLKFRPDVWW